MKHYKYDPLTVIVLKDDFIDVESTFPACSLFLQTAGKLLINRETSY